MSDYVARLRGDPLPWLLEDDREQPGVRYFALRWLLRRGSDDADVRAAQATAMQWGPVPAILAQQDAGGYWGDPGAPYAKHTSTVWQLIFLGWLGADGGDPRVAAACDWTLDRLPGPAGGFSHNGTQSGIIHCLNGQLLRACIDLGWLEDERTQRALSWAADAILGRGDPQFRQSGTSGPGFACSVNGKLPCGWGAVKELLALAAVPPSRRSAAVQAAVDFGVEFLLGHDLTKADFPTATTISGRWFRFGFPASYSADILELLLALAELGRAGDPRAAAAIEVVLSKQDADGRWRLETSLNGKMVVDVERKGQPSKWLTLRALRVLSAAPSPSG